MLQPYACAGGILCNVSLPDYVADVNFPIDDGHLLRRDVDLSATNGVVHKIDTVLIPESLKSQL